MTITKDSTPEQRARWNEYQRAYRAKHPEKLRQWRENAKRRKMQRDQITSTNTTATAERGQD